MKKVITLSTERAEAQAAIKPIHLLVGKIRRPEVDKEILELIKLSDQDLQKRLKSCIATGTKISGEALICLIRIFTREKNRTLLDLVFRLFTKQYTTTLMYDAHLLPKDEQQDHAYDVFLKIIAAAKEAPKSLDYAEVNFNHYLQRRSIDEYRKKRNTFEMKNQRLTTGASEEDEDESSDDTLEDMPNGRRSPEEYAIAWDGLRKLPTDLRRVFFLYHYCDLDQAQIAERYDISVKTVYNWLTEARKLLK